MEFSKIHFFKKIEVFQHFHEKKILTSTFSNFRKFLSHNVVTSNSKTHNFDSKTLKIHFFKNFFKPPPSTPPPPPPPPSTTHQWISLWNEPMRHTIVLVILVFRNIWAQFRSNSDSCLISPTTRHISDCVTTSTKNKHRKVVAFDMWNASTVTTKIQSWKMFTTRSRKIYFENKARASSNTFLAHHHYFNNYGRWNSPKWTWRKLPEFQKHHRNSFSNVTPPKRDFQILYKKCQTTDVPPFTTPYPLTPKNVTIRLECKG